MKEITYCNALNANVRITRKGWDHLLSGSHKRKRKTIDKRRRLSLLKAAKYVIKESSTSYISTRNGTKYTVITAHASKENLKVVLKKDKSGDYYFWSVM